MSSNKKLNRKVMEQPFLITHPKEEATTIRGKRYLSKMFFPLIAFLIFSISAKAAPELLWEKVNGVSYHAEFSPDDRYLVVERYQQIKEEWHRVIHFYETATGNMYKTIVDEGSFKFSSDGKYLITRPQLYQANPQESLIIHTYPELNIVRTLPDVPIFSKAYGDAPIGDNYSLSPDNKYICVGYRSESATPGHKGGAKLYNFENGKFIKELKIQEVEYILTNPTVTRKNRDIDYVEYNSVGTELLMRYSYSSNSNSTILAYDLLKDTGRVIKYSGSIGDVRYYTLDNNKMCYSIYSGDKYTFQIVDINKGEVVQKNSRQLFCIWFPIYYLFSS